jgi:hypothetical protein
MNVNDSIDDNNRTASPTTATKKKATRTYKPKEETKPVYIITENYKFLEKKAEERNMSLRSFVNYLSHSFLRKEELLKKLYPGMSLYSIGKSSLFIKDYRDTFPIDTKSSSESISKDDKTNRPPPPAKTVEVSIIKKDDNSLSLYCSFDNSDECKHIQYALGLPEIYLLLVDERFEELQENGVRVTGHIAEGVIELIRSGKAPHGIKLYHDGSDVFDFEPFQQGEVERQKKEDSNSSTDKALTLLTNRGL